MPERDSEEPPFEVLAPQEQTAPVVFASPHSGRVYPQDFLDASRLDATAIRRSEDAFIDELFASAVSHGAPLLRANFPRAYMDPNREAYELDPAMFIGRLPDYVNTRSPRVAAGLGTIAKVVASGEEIYATKLPFSEVERRLLRCYRPYHAALARLIEDTKAKFGACLLVDCHSMPSIGGPTDADPGLRRVDVVLGDRFGTACARELVVGADDLLTDLGLVVTRNDPYAGGFTTRHYGKPGEGIHALQIEVNRSLYMDERAIERGEGMEMLAGHLERLVEVLITTAREVVVPR